MLHRVLIAAATLTLAGVSLAHAQQPAANAQASAAPAVAANGAPASPTAKAGDAELRKRLTPEQYAVTCEAATEPAFHNAYWDNHRPGIYVDVISGKPLFSSKDKFESGTGWPSFTKPLVATNVEQKTDTSLGMDRTEIKAKDSGAHLGHVFDDGPADKGGMRYCLNSASLRFVPVDQLETQGYGEYLPLFRTDAQEREEVGAYPGKNFLAPERTRRRSAVATSGGFSDKLKAVGVQAACRTGCR